jgi:hypothetical protein
MKQGVALGFRVLVICMLSALKRVVGEIAGLTVVVVETATLSETVGKAGWTVPVVAEPEGVKVLIWFW